MSNQEFKQEQQEGFSMIYHHKFPYEQRITSDGKMRNAAIIVKQTSFTIVILSKIHSFQNCELDCSLVYDNEELSEVNFITQKPLTYTSFLHSDKSMNVDLKILVLSSQHEDMLFKVKFNIHDSNSNKYFVLYSESLRVISKADHKKKGRPMKLMNISPNPMMKIDEQMKQVIPIQKIQNESKLEKKSDETTKQSVTLSGDEHDETVIREKNESNQLDKNVQNVQIPQQDEIHQSDKFEMKLNDNHDTKNSLNQKIPKEPQSLKIMNQIKIKKEAKLIDYNYQTSFTDQILEDTFDIVEAQHVLLKQLVDELYANPLIIPLKSLMQVYTTIPQQMRIDKMMRFLFSLSPEQINTMNDMIEIFKTCDKQD